MSLMPSLVSPVKSCKSALVIGRDNVGSVMLVIFGGNIRNTIVGSRGRGAAHEPPLTHIDNSVRLVRSARGMFVGLPSCTGNVRDIYSMITACRDCGNANCMLYMPADLTLN